MLMIYRFFSGHLFFLYSLKIFPHYDNLFDIVVLKEYFLRIYSFIYVFFASLTISLQVVPIEFSIEDICSVLRKVVFNIKFDMLCNLLVNCQQLFGASGSINIFLYP